METAPTRRQVRGQRTTEAERRAAAGGTGKRYDQQVKGESAWWDVEDEDTREENDAAEETLSRLATRRVTTARPLRSEDRAVVERTTQAMRALTLAQGAETTGHRSLGPALGEQTRVVATWDVEPERAPVTIITATVAVSPLAEELRRARQARQGARGRTANWVVLALFVALTVAQTQGLASGKGSALWLPKGALGVTNPGALAQEPGWASYANANPLGIGGGAGPGVHAPGSAGLSLQRAAGLPEPTPVPPAPQPQPSTPSTSSASGGGVVAAPVTPWPPSDAYMFVPGHPAFAMNDVNNYYAWAFGQCTWWAQFKRQDENLTHMGNAQYWAGGAAARGYSVGGTPVAGATAVFQPGVQGAGGAGHVAHVEAVYPDGWFLISEMNFYWNGGGWGRVDYRFAHAGGGVSFIY